LEVRYSLHNLGKATHPANRKAQRSTYLDTLADALSGKRNDDVKIFLIQQLQWFGDASIVAKLAPLLESNNRKVFDATVATLEMIGANETLRGALAKTKHKTALILVLGRLKDKASAKSIRSALGDEDLEVRVAAGTAIARIVDAGSTDDLLKAADGATLGTFQRNRLNDACLVAAENLVGVKESAAAKTIYSHLQSKRTDPREKHVLDAAALALKNL
jgi:HEAT repeat protein